jgi:hypothetical protein
MLKVGFGQQKKGSGGISVEDAECSGRPSMSKTDSVDRVKKLLEKEKNLYICQTVIMFRISSGSIQSILKDSLNRCYTGTKFEPHT